MSTPKLTSAEWIDRITREEAIWNELVAAAGDRYDEPGPMGDWTFRNLAHHLNGWRIRTVQRLEAAAEGREPDPAPWPAELVNDADEDATVDAINDWSYEVADGPLLYEDAGKLVVDADRRAMIERRGGTEPRS